MGGRVAARRVRRESRHDVSRRHRGSRRRHRADGAVRAARALARGGAPAGAGRPPARRPAQVGRTRVRRPAGAAPLGRRHGGAWRPSRHVGSVLAAVRATLPLPSRRHDVHQEVADVQRRSLGRPAPGGATGVTRRLVAGQPRRTQFGDVVRSVAARRATARRNGHRRRLCVAADAAPRRCASRRRKRRREARRAGAKLRGGGRRGDLEL